MSETKDKEIFAETVLGCSYTTWCKALNCSRNLSYKFAKRAAQALNTPVELWIDPDASHVKRKAAWDKYRFSPSQRKAKQRAA